MHGKKFRLLQATLDDASRAKLGFDLGSGATGAIQVKLAGKIGDKDSKIAATAHHNYIVVLPTQDDLLVALSLSRTASGKAKDFNATLKMGKGPLQSRLYTVETIDDSRDGHDFKNYKFKNVGYVDEASFKRYEALATSFKGRTINVDQSDGDDAPVADERA